MAIHMATTEDFGKDIGNVKCATKHLKDPDLEEPDPMTDDKQKTG